MNEEELKNQEQEVDDVELAELANKELRARDVEIAKLKRELAKEKLYSRADEDEQAPRTKEEIIKSIGESVSQYDYAENVVELMNCCEREGTINQLGEDAIAVRDFFQECLDECGDDKTKFVSVYQARLGPDSPNSALAFKKRR